MVTPDLWLTSLDLDSVLLIFKYEVPSQCRHTYECSPQLELVLAPLLALESALVEFLELVLELDELVWLWVVVALLDSVMVALDKLWPELIFVEGQGKLSPESVTWTKFTPCGRIIYLKMYGRLDI